MRTRTIPPRRTVNGAVGRGAPVRPRGWLRWVVVGGLGLLGFLTSYAAVTLTRKPPAAVEAARLAAAPEQAGQLSPCCTDQDDRREDEATAAPAIDRGGVSPTVHDRAAPGPAPEG